MQPGSEERKADQHQRVEIRGEKKEEEKNKIYFIWNFGKDPYLCTPNDKEGQKNRNGGCREDNKNKIETDGNMFKTNKT